MRKRPGTIRLGQIVATRGALGCLSGDDVSAALMRHRSGDWGTVGDEDWRANDYAAEHGERILSVYRAELGETFWVITEADRSVTTVLLPDEY